MAWPSCRTASQEEPTGSAAVISIHVPVLRDARWRTSGASLSSIPSPFILMFATITGRFTVTLMPRLTTVGAWILPPWGLLGREPFPLAGHRSGHRAAEAIVMMAVGSFGYGCVGGGSVTSLVGAASPAGHRSCDHAADASVMEAVGRAGYGCLGVDGGSPLATMVATWTAIGRCFTRPRVGAIALIVGQFWRVTTVATSRWMKASVGPSPRSRRLGWSWFLLAGRCSCDRAAETIVVMVVGCGGYGCLSGGAATFSAEAAPFSGQCSRYRAAEASVMEAVGRIGNGCLGGGGQAGSPMAAGTWPRHCKCAIGSPSGGTLGAAAACGPLAPTVLAHPCRCTIAARLPERAAVTALGTDGLWPHPRRRGPMPRAAALRRGCCAR